jgi:hypothetical protein
MFRFVRYVLHAQLFCITKVIANLQLEAEHNFYEVLWIRRSSYCFIVFSFKLIIYSFQNSPSTCSKFSLKRNVNFPRKQ